MSVRGTWWRRGSSLLGVGLVVLTSACSGAPASDGVGAPGQAGTVTASTIAGGGATVPTLPIGTCFTFSDDGPNRRSAAVPCSEPHDSEVVANLDASADVENACAMAAQLRADPESEESVQAGLLTPDGTSTAIVGPITCFVKTEKPRTTPLRRPS